MELSTNGLRELSLFSGAGGGLLGTTHILGWQTVCYVEYEEYAQRVLAARIRDGLLHDAPIWDNVHTLDPTPWRGKVDVVSAGFPCQPFSVAGKQYAGDDERNGWPSTIDIIRAVQPRYCFLENVPGLLAGSHGYFGTVLSDLAQAGYDARWCVLSAADLGAPHQRKRLWIVGTRHTNSNGEPTKPINAEEASGLQGLASNAHGDGLRNQQEPERWRSGAPKSELNGEVWDVANATSERRGAGRKGGFACEHQGIQDAAGNVANADRAQLERVWESERTQAQHPHASRTGWWLTEPDVGRVADGVASRVDRLKALGNGQVPCVAARAWQMLTGDQ